MGNRIELHTLISSVMPEGVTVYFQPPNSINLQFPCVIYSRTGKAENFAGNELYNSKYEYSVLVISRDPDNDLSEQLVKIPFTSYDRRYEANGLYHDVVKLYF